MVGCGFSHMNNDDPIVFPGKPGASHNHTFIGNRAVDAATTPASLLGGESSRPDVGDASAYWVPTLFSGRPAVKPLVGVGYYVRRTLGPVRAFPPGLKMIAGNANARRPQSLSVVGWGCGGVGAPPRSTVVPSCPPDQALHLRATFPSCWNGRDARQRRPSAPPGLRRRRDVPALAPGGAAEPGADLPLPVDRSRPAAPGLGPLRRACRLRQRLGSRDAGGAGRDPELGATIAPRGYSSAGRAPGSQSGGRRFEPA